MHIPERSAREKDPVPIVLRGDSRPDLLRDECLPDILSATAHRRPDHPALIWGERVVTYRRVERGQRRAGRRVDAPGGGGRPDRGIVHAARCGPADRASGHLEERGGLVAVRCRDAAGTRRDLSAVGRRLRTGHLPRLAAPAGEPVRARVGGRGSVWRRRSRSSCASTDGEPQPDGSGVRDLHLGLDGAAEGHRRSATAASAISCAARTKCWACAKTIACTRDSRWRSTCRSRRSGSRTWWAPRCGSLPRELVGDPERVAQAIARHRITVLHAVPTLDGVDRRSAADRAAHQSRRRSVPRGVGRTAGAAGARTVQHLWADRGHRLGHPGEVAAGQPVTIGMPLPNYGLMVVDEQRRPLPAGEVGELGIFGPGVAIGYLGRPELTADRFVANPLAAGPDEARMYLTGDLGRIDRGRTGALSGPGRRPGQDSRVPRGTGRDRGGHDRSARRRGGGRGRAAGGRDRSGGRIRRRRRRMAKWNRRRCAGR